MPLFLTAHRRVTLAWVPEHLGVAGNESADELARNGSATPVVSPEPCIPGLTLLTEAIHIKMKIEFFFKLLVIAQYW